MEFNDELADFIAQSIDKHGLDNVYSGLFEQLKMMIALSGDIDAKINVASQFFGDIMRDHFKDDTDFDNNFKNS